jgi:hypothetical protein
MRHFSIPQVCTLLALLHAAPLLHARSLLHAALDEGELRLAVFPSVNTAALKAHGPEAIPVLLRWYAAGDAADRRTLAYALSTLNWRYPAAKSILMQDARAEDPMLRVTVWHALLALAADAQVIDTLVDIMLEDPDPFIRDKSACTLANTTLRVGEEQKVRLFGRLIRALEHPREETRDFAVRILRQQTGQTRNFDPRASPEIRAAGVQAWKDWLREYASNL